jgi:hypothetical protein
MMYKRQNKKNNGAWRLGIGFMQNVADSTLPVKPWAYMIYRLKTNLSIGYEWQKNISPKFLFYYGADIKVALDYEKKSGTRNGWIVNGVLNYESGFIEKTDIIYSINPFLGFRYQASRRFYIATEVSINGFVNDYKHIERFKFSNGIAWDDDDLLHTGISFQPYSGVYIFYQF